MTSPQNALELGDALHTLAVMGDLSMGQPIDHSQRVAQLSARLAQHLGWHTDAVLAVWQVAQLRGSGCTAIAAEFATVIRDDVGGRALMLQLEFDQMEFLVPHPTLPEHMALVSTIHCDVATLIAHLLALNAEVSALKQTDRHRQQRMAQAAIVATKPRNFIK